MDGGRYHWYSTITTNVIDFMTVDTKKYIKKYREQDDHLKLFLRKQNDVY